MRRKSTLANLTGQTSLARRTVQAVLIGGVFFAGFGLLAADTNSALTRITEIRSLTPAMAAEKIPLCVTGVVTVVEPRWWGQFILQDSSGGIFVDNQHSSPPAPGDLVKVTGVSDPGGFTPCIESPVWQKLGTASLPEAKPVSIEQFMSGVDDGNRVEISGVVKAAKAEGTRMDLDLEAGGHVFQALPSFTSAIDPNFLLGATLLVRGTEGTVYDTEKKRLANVTIFIPQSSDFIIEEAPGKTSEVATDTVLTTAVQILALTSARASELIPVLVTGVVTGAQSNWGGRFFLQDSTCGVFVNSSNTPPAVGDVVQVKGVTSPGGFAPDINSISWKKMGQAPLPEAKPVSIEQFLSGSEDGERIEISGVVTMTQVVKTWLEIELKSGGERAQAFIPLPANPDPNSLIGATVRIRGTAAASFNATLRHLLTVLLFAPQESDLIVDQLPDATVSQESFAPLNHIAQYRRNNSSDSRIRVKGVVTYQRPGEDIFLHDKTGGLRVKYSGTNIFAPGDIVEAIGFPGVEDSLPILEDAILKRTGKSEKAIAPEEAAFQELFQGYHHSDLIMLRGELLDRSLRPLPTGQMTNSENILTLKNDRYFFTVETPSIGPFATLASIPIGSTLQVSGICLLRAGDEGKIETIQVVPIDAASIHILQKPSWWTPRRLLIALGILLVVSLAGIAWMLMIHQKNSALKLSIAEKIKAQEELQKAHDQLETRVEERTNEWKFEMSARKEAEIQYKAILSERTRLAQELHDTLLQGFTGVGLKLDAVTSSLPPSLAATKEQIQKILKQSDEYLSEARRSVWQLRSPSLQTSENFPEALKKVSERALQSTRISLRFTTYGTESRLEQGIEDNFLRICEEAVTNAVKHANPSEVEVALEYLPKELRLRIRDNGYGFDPNGPASTKDGHFGLLGIRERTKRLAGNLSLNSRPGKGTEILVVVSTPSES